MVKRGDMMSIDDIIDILAIDLIGVVPDDEKIIVSTNKGEPAVTDNKSAAGAAYRAITRRIMARMFLCLIWALKTVLCLKSKSCLG